MKIIGFIIFVIVIGVLYVSITSIYIDINDIEVEDGVDDLIKDK